MHCFIFGRMQDSSSSFSMSLSGSDTFEDQPSTSGCRYKSLTGLFRYDTLWCTHKMFISYFLFNIYSSDMTHKEKRKARVKQYLRQLKAMVPPSSGKKGKMGTLSALQHVIGSLQKIQGMHLIDGAGDKVLSGLYIMYY